MAVLRGDNFRALINNKCVAAARSCTCHIAMQLEDVSTKDSDGGWLEQEPVEHSWDGSVEALVTDGIYDAQKVVADTEVSGGGGDVFQSTKALTLQPGQTFFVAGDTNVFIMGENSPLTELSAGMSYYTNESTTAIKVFAACDIQDEELNVYITDAKRATCSELLTAYFAGNEISVQFAVTEGHNNIVVRDSVLEGQANINSLEIVAQSKNTAIFTLGFTGTGELERVEE